MQTAKLFPLKSFKTWIKNLMGISRSRVVTWVMVILKCFTTLKFSSAQKKNWDPFLPVGELVENSIFADQ